ncbi:MAG: NADH-quinone oxidoreductase subunit NuoG [Oryzomonas sp.]|uniref:NADH-quinone oxidoreductase subunit NuoG n=1 Tax=Oryzomonas sp. TaxID=2855186 RepID=UPI002845D955|nr:NADH-quinone oxidoreductase subunit NuoG [Oryzomonas sp.]MDR3581530.1 NADH-quinone oxidoreductase subunit NuoG [Oryzomonas sp.]
MPKLIIDDIPVEVPDGTTVLEAAQSVDIPIPHFCWHPALGKAGACRVCAVKLLDGPVKGVQMSCMLPAMDGMVVSTTDDEAVAMRKSVIEWLMINHPHDCPVCDEGGECQLQDFTIAGGHGIRRYDGRKRTYRNQYLGEFIEHEMNRCIQCYRCTRFYQEYAGGTDFGAMGRAAIVYFGRQDDGPLESPFSGNLVDICPTGVFTDKTARFRARYWDYDMAPSVCPHCSLGCNTVPMARYRELLKTTARRNDSVNGWFICDKGRFSNAGVNAPERPRQALVGGKPVSLAEALDALATLLGEFLELHGPESLAIVGSPRMDLAGNIMAARLREMLGAGTLCLFNETDRAELTGKAVSLLTTENSSSQEDMRNADLIALEGCDLLDEAPMMALAVRQAWRSGARVYMVGTQNEIQSAMAPPFTKGGPGGILQQDQTANPPQSPLGPRGSFVKGGHNREATALPFAFEQVASLADVPLAEAKRPVIICGASRTGLESIGEILSDSTASFDKGGLQPALKLAFILDGPNAFGCAELARRHHGVALSTALADGRIKGIISFEADLSHDLPQGITVLGAADWRPTGLMTRAGVVLPTTTWVEQEGIFVNNEGRAQRFKKVMNPGLPIKGLTPELHPPRVHGIDAPGGDVAPSARLIAMLMQRLGETMAVEPLSGPWETLKDLDATGAGVMIHKGEQE